MDPSSVKRRLTCILAADAAGYSRQMGDDEEGTIRVLAAHRAVIDGIITFHQGRIVSTAGDSVLAEFTSVVEAVRCAVEIQEALKTRNDSLPEHRQMHFRVGVNLGDVVVKNEDLLGDGVNVAARLETMADPGGICISSSVYDQITGKLDLGFQDIGEQTLKNISRPIHVYRVSGAAPPVRSPSSATPHAPAAASNPSGGRPLPWIVGAIAAIAIGAVVAWQGGWLRAPFSNDSSGSAATVPAESRSPVPVVTSTVPTSAAVDAKTLHAQAESDALRVRAEADAIKRQAESELARARSDADAAKAARMNVEASAAAARTRALADADAARIRAEAESSAARTRSEADAAARAIQLQAAVPAQVRPAADAAARTSPATAQETRVPDKGTRAVAGDAGQFDGVWNVAVECPKADDGALGYRYEFMAQVKDGLLRGDQGTEGNAGWLRLQGKIEADGTARLDAKGLTGDPKYNLKSVRKGAPYEFQVAARFVGSRGTGLRLQLRPCVLTFVRQ